MASHSPTVTWRKRFRTEPRAKPSWPTSNVSSPRATRRWSATPASAASSRPKAGHFAIDQARADGTKFDGVFVLRTNTDLDPLAAIP